MEFTKLEKWWLFLSLLFYGLYNLPGVPAYYDAKGCVIHGALTIIPLYTIIFVGDYLVNKKIKLRKYE